MSHVFDPAIVSGVLAHMNFDHTDDNLLIARAFSERDDIVASEMAGFDGAAGTWRVTDAAGHTSELSVPWPNGPITERPEVRHEIVALYDAACQTLGITPRPHG